MRTGLADIGAGAGTPTGGIVGGKAAAGLGDGESAGGVAGVAGVAGGGVTVRAGTGAGVGVVSDILGSAVVTVIDGFVIAAGGTVGIFNGLIAGGIAGGAVLGVIVSAGALSEVGVGEIAGGIVGIFNGLIVGLIVGGAGVTGFSIVGLTLISLISLVSLVVSLGCSGLGNSGLVIGCVAEQLSQLSKRQPLCLACVTSTLRGLAIALNCALTVLLV